MKTPQKQRDRQILDIIEREGSVRIDDLAGMLQIAEITVRRDLARLESEGLILKTHGGASKREPSLSELLFEKRLRESEPEKRRIGAAAAEMIVRGDTLFLDTGTTTLHIARALKGLPASAGVTVVTNSIFILAELRFARDLNLILLGGTYRTGDYALSGPITEKNLETFRAKWAFLGADGISAANGVTTNDIYTAEVTRSMLARAERPVLVADHAKIGRAGSIKYAEIDDFSLLITDAGLPEGAAGALEGATLEVRRV